MIMINYRHLHIAAGLRAIFEGSFYTSLLMVSLGFTGGSDTLAMLAAQGATWALLKFSKKFKKNHVDFGTPFWSLPGSHGGS